MNFKITTLVENVVYGKGLQGGHGLSLFIETPGFAWASRGRFSSAINLMAGYILIIPAG